MNDDNMLRLLRKANLKHKRKLMEEFLIYQENALLQVLCSMAAVRRCGFELVDHPVCYSHLTIICSIT